MGYQISEPGRLRTWQRVAAVALLGAVALLLVLVATGLVPRTGAVITILGLISLPICWMAARWALGRG
jgi:hypothetical protein